MIEERKITSDQDRDAYLQSAYFVIVGSEYHPCLVEIRPEKEETVPPALDASERFEDDCDRYIQFTFERWDWDSRLRMYYVFHEGLGQRTLDHSVHLGLLRPLYRWKWKYEGEKRWRQADDLTRGRVSKFFPGRRRSTERVLVRTSYSKALDTLRNHLHDASEALRLIMETYDPPPDMEGVLKMMKDGPTAEQEFIGTPKYMNGMKIDGSRVQVSIV
ncbi:hypothetical protein SLS60_009926 [Paraconiothyrium brasiliense]|uniref:Uncharacterized protein n=1 Tax=Paraconiothyrium brasiliense TaxID=300254 RepID=A0ABR3QSV5_9PLEO